MTTATQTLHFEFATAPRVVFGAGTIREAGPAARAHGRRALVVTGRDVARAEPLFAVLREQGVNAVSYSVTGEPTLETIREGTALARAQSCDQRSMSAAV